MLEEGPLPEGGPPSGLGISASSCSRAASGSCNQGRAGSTGGISACKQGVWFFSTLANLPEQHRRSPVFQGEAERFAGETPGFRGKKAPLQASLPPRFFLMKPRPG